MYAPSIFSFIFLSNFLLGSTAHFFPGQGCGTDSPIRIVQYSNKSEVGEEEFLEDEAPCTLVKSIEHIGIKKWIPGQIYAGERRERDKYESLRVHFLV